MPLPLLLLTSAGCSWSPPPEGADRNGDNSYGFADLERGYVPDTEPTFEQRFNEHLDRQKPEYYCGPGGKRK